MADIYQFVLPPRREWTSHEARLFHRLRKEGRFGILVPFDPNGPRRKVPRRRLATPEEWKRIRRKLQRYLAKPEDQKLLAAFNAELARFNQPSGAPTGRTNGRKEV